MSSDSDDMFLAMIVLIPLGLFLCVVTAPVWLPIAVGRGMYLLYREVRNG